MKRHITYTRVSAEGFQSLITPVQFPLNQIGLNIVQGENGNGKSTLCNDSIAWGEFGETSKQNVVTWVDQRTPEFRGTRVVIDRTDGEFDYRVARHIAFKGTTMGVVGGDSLLLYKKRIDEPTFTKEHQIGSGQHKADVQKLINEQLGIDYTTFKNSIIFGQKMASLVEADNKDKRNLFEKLFEVGFVDFAKTNADYELKETESKLAIVKNDLNTLDQNIEWTKADIDAAELADKNFYTEKESRCATARAEVEKYKKHIKDDTAANVTDEAYLKALTTKELDKATAAKEALDTKLNLLNSNKDTFNSDKTTHANSLRTANANLERYKEELAQVKDKCTTCGSPVKPEDLKKVKANIQTKIKAEETIISTLGIFDTKSLDANTKLIEKCKLDIEEARKAIAKFDNIVADKATYTANIANRIKSIANYKAFLKTAEENLAKEVAAEKPANDLKNLKEKLKGFMESETAKTESVAVLTKKKDYIEWWIKKGFGAAGIKAFVFNAMLTQLNHYSYKYAAKLGFRIEFSIDMKKASKPFQTLIYSGEHVRDYNDLSGGQKQRVNACLAFAMHDLITRDTSFNIFVVDEMTESLDRAGNEAFFEFIRMKAEDKAVYVISHLDIIDSSNARIINISSVNGNTVIA